MVICYLFARKHGRFLLSYDNLFKDVLYTKSIPRKIKYNESTEQQKRFREHVSRNLGQGIKYYYKYIYPKR